MLTTETFRAVVLTELKIATEKGYDILKGYETEAAIAISRVKLDSIRVQLKENAPHHTIHIAYFDASAAHVISTITATAQRTFSAVTVDVFAIRWVDTKGIQQLSLRRPLDSQLNLTVLAKLYKGGGHEEASGVQGRTTLEQL